LSFFIISFRVKPCCKRLACSLPNHTAFQVANSQGSIAQASLWKWHIHTPPLPSQTPPHAHRLHSPKMESKKRTFGRGSYSSTSKSLHRIVSHRPKNGIRKSHLWQGHVLLRFQVKLRGIRVTSPHSFYCAGRGLNVNHITWGHLSCGMQVT